MSLLPLSHRRKLAYGRYETGTGMRRAIGIKVGARDAERRIEAAQLGQHQPADFQTALGSRDKEKAGAIGVANSIGGWLTGRSAARAPSTPANNHAYGRSRKEPLDEAHFVSSSPRTL